MTLLRLPATNSNLLSVNTEALPTVAEPHEPATNEMQSETEPHEPATDEMQSDTVEKSTSDNTVSSVADYLNQFVVVSYDSKPYPGKVIDINEQQGDLQISCMHRVGHNRFFLA
jgi:hypothetical protein